MIITSKLIYIDISLIFVTMNKVMENKNIEEALNHICTHKLFMNSPALIELLKYLVIKTLDKEDLNEIKIGSELYGIDYSINKSNSTVRSYMHKLRGKLHLYYDEVETNEAIIFHIEKGSYHVSFISPSKHKKLKKSQSETITIPVKHIKLFVGVLLISVIAIVSTKFFISKPSPIWENYFKNQAENMVIVSDQFMVFGKVWDDKMYGVTYPKINSHNEFINYTQENPDILIKPADYTMMSKMAPITIKMLSHWFYTNNSDFKLQFESKLKYEDNQSHNIIFVGQYKTMNVSKSLFLKDSKVFSTFGDGFKYAKNGIEKKYNTSFNTNNTVEYAMVSYHSLNKDKSTLYFISNNDIGVIATLKNFTNKKWLKAFYQQLPSNSNHFNALFKVKGIHRNDVSCELIEIEVLD
ncbi:hypothetical protein [Labilibacter marinus]|uniref:hypothetical protein n=1 Tax=Labilibacter marinus TaxID=1477105 RepID=UPI00094FFA46|nr:hypothetical protein [Labilibacter marinus]